MKFNIQPRRRFSHTGPREPEKAKHYRDLEAAMQEGRTIYPTRVLDVGAEAMCLKRGDSNGKTGNTVAVEMWRWMPIFTLTLEERGTCPRSCPFYRIVEIGGRLFSCYGNSMRAARRWKHGPDLVRKLHSELDLFSILYPYGFVVRLHILGDFFSEEYARFWMKSLQEFPALHLFGFTAHPETNPIGETIAEGNRNYPGRCVIRFSNRGCPMGTRVIANASHVKIGEIVCPASQHRNPEACCALCGMCWSRPDACIDFIAHDPIRLDPAIDIKGQ